MSVDYNQVTEDHQSFLVLVKHTGKQLPWKHFAHCWDRIRHLDYLGIPGQKRNMYIRYRKNYPKELNEWGDFQGHRKALGLICFGKCSTEQEFQELFNLYKKEKSEYADTLFNSRLIVFGMNSDGSPLTEEQKKKLEDLSPPISMKIDNATSINKTCDNDKVSDKENDTNGNCTDQREFVDPLRSSETQKPAMTNSPKTDKKPVQRNLSNTLSKDTPGSEVVFYESMDSSGGLEESVKEFVTSLFFVLEGKRLDRSFERADRQVLLCAPFEKKDYVGIDPDSKSYKRKCQGRLRKHLADLCLQAGLPGEAMLHYTTAIDILKQVNDWLWMGGCYEGLCAASVVSTYVKLPVTSQSLRRNQSFSVKRGVAGIDKHKQGTMVHTGSYANGLQDLPESASRSNLNQEDILEKYKEALMLYSKYKNAAIVEIEASLKACRVMIIQKKFLEAADFLQNVVYINYTISEEDRIQRYSTLSNLYSQIGFRRKSSFFKRVSAMQCVAPTNPKPNWHLCHQLLVQTLIGYKIHLDPKECKLGHSAGWTILQTRVLHEMIYSARRMGNLPVAVRYTSLMLYAFLDQLSAQERREAVASLEGFTAQCEGMNNPLALETGVILPAVPLLNIPLVKSFKLMPLNPHLEPKLLKPKETSDNGVFIFTPINFGVDTSDTIKTEMDFCWVEGDMAEVQLHVINPMPDELKIAHIGLITEGAEIETFPTSPSIPAESGQYLVKIMSRPTSSGDLTIHGYSTKLYGVRSNCKLQDCPTIPQSHFKVKVIPGLPQVSVTTTLPKSASFLSFGEDLNVVTSGSATMYTGQSCECLVTLQNTGRLPVDMVKVSLEGAKDTKGCLDEVFQWNTENIDSQLPLQLSSLLCFNIALYASGDFLQQSKCMLKTSQDLTDSGNTEGKTVEAVLKLEYSGGKGLEAGYCRCCSVAFTIDILPSVVFHKWDVMNSESSDHCYLLFDIQNVSGHEMELLYSNQCTYLKHEQIRRVTLQIERCHSQPEGTTLSNTEFSQYLATFVDIRWVIPTEKVDGKVNIDHLPWTLEQQQLVYMSPVAWEIRLNDQVLSPLHIGFLEYRLGQQVQLDVELNIKTDLAEEDYQTGVLSVCCCQHCDNGRVVYDVSQHVMPMGAQSLVIPKVCSRHFVDGKPSKENPVPSLHMGYENVTTPKPRRQLFRKPLVSTDRNNNNVKSEDKPESMEYPFTATRLNIDEGDLDLSAQVEPFEKVECPSSCCYLNPSFCYNQSNHFTNSNPVMVDSCTQTEDFVKLDHPYYFDKISKTVSTQHTTSEFSISNITTDTDARFYTGLNLTVLMTLITTLIPFGKHLSYKLKIEDQILSVFMRLRLGLNFHDIGRRLNVSRQLAASMFHSWIDIMATELSDLITWLPRETIRRTLPLSFSNTYPNTTCIIDCTEVFIQRPFTLKARNQTYSNYKSKNTAKFLVAIAPNGYIMFISKAYGGRASDNYITKTSGFLNYLLPGDEVMADRGFTVGEELCARQVKLNIPSFMKGRTQLSAKETIESRRIASVRIHVERAINRMKCYRILNTTVNIKSVGKMDKKMRVISALCNLQDSLIKDDHIED